MINIGGTTVYHLGDTCLFGDMKLIAERTPVDVALIPIGGHYTMDRHDAVVAAELIGAGTVIPMHYNTFPPIETDAEAFKADVESKTELEGASCSSPARRHCAPAGRLQTALRVLADWPVKAVAWRQARWRRQLGEETEVEAGTESTTAAGPEDAHDAQRDRQPGGLPRDLGPGASGVGRPRQGEPPRLHRSSTSSGSASSGRPRTSTSAGTASTGTSGSRPRSASSACTASRRSSSASSGSPTSSGRSCAPAPTEEQRIFLSTQIADEARHVRFFNRFYEEVGVLEGADDLADRLRATEEHLNEPSASSSTRC